MKIRRGIQFILDRVFPVFCIECKKEGQWICADCVEKNISGRCKRLENISPFLFEHIYLMEYDEKTLLGKAIRTLKYEYIEEMEIVFESFIKKTIPKKLDYDIIVPVPLHKKRYAERGFNQVDIITKVLNKHTGISVNNVLKRTRATKQQARLTKEERLQNMDNSFTCTNKLEVSSILLVDDVYTTGATIDACIKAITKSGNIRRIGCFTLAKG